MAGVLFYLPNARQLSVSGGILPGWTATFYLTGTTTARNVYADGDLSTSLGNIVEADADGHMPPIYLDPDVTYRVLIKDANGVLQPDGDVDPIDVSRGEGGGGGGGGPWELVEFVQTTTDSGANFTSTAFTVQAASRLYKFDILFTTSQTVTGEMTISFGSCSVTFVTDSSIHSPLRLSGLITIANGSLCLLVNYDSTANAGAGYDVTKRVLVASDKAGVEPSTVTDSLEITYANNNGGQLVGTIERLVH